MSDGSRDERVLVDEDGLLARYAQWRSRTTGRQIAALGPADLSATSYVADEVIVDGDDRDLVEELVGRYGAEVVADRELPDPPEQLHVEQRGVADEAPQVVRLRFSAPPRVDGRDDLLQRAVRDGREVDGQVVATSEIGAAVAAVVTLFALDERPIGLNLLGEPLSMPLETATEGNVPGVGANPFAWTAFAGRSRMVEAWQLMDSIRQLRTDPFVVLAVLDRGFWLDAAGAPNVAPGQPASDLGAGVMQINLNNEGTPAGGMAPSGMAWHGNAVASSSAGLVNNAAGAAGSGGTVATPMLFLTDISIDQILRCVRMCAAWGIDVLNMSIGTWDQTELWFPTSSWNNTFQFAADNDVVMVAAAGNDNLDLPDDRNVRPATRTPGVLTIGALDAADNKASFSNHGSSINLWAPGTAIPVAPDGNNPAGSRPSGTSFASPIVAGVAAMMRSANPALNAHEIRRLLVETGWNGSGPVGKGLDAYAALFAAVKQTLPDDSEPNNTPATARGLIPTGPGGALQPGLGPFTARSTANDPDYWHFTVDRFSTVTVAVDWYERLGTLFVAVESDNPDARGPDEMTRGGSTGAGKTTLSGLLPPGGYRVRVGGTGVTGYRLQVMRASATLARDQFEVNDSLESAARMLFQASNWSPFLLRTWGPGTYDATLHQQRFMSPWIGGGITLGTNDDWFRLEVPAALIFSQPTVSVFDADQPVDVELYDASRTVIRSWRGVRNMTEHPPPGTTCYLRVSGEKVTRYRISTRMTADHTKIPGPFEEELELIPKWWGDPPPVELFDPITHYLHEVGSDRGEGPLLAFAGVADNLRIELLDREGSVIREAREKGEALLLDTEGLEPGAYVVRVSRFADGAQLRMLPPIGFTR
ncbi:MAG: S8/S53 family peptidase [Nocardioides sp.]|nr:S8/S53 family peptidase [Nocardioides sp.]